MAAFTIIKLKLRAGPSVAKVNHVDLILLTKQTHHEPI